MVVLISLVVYTVGKIPLALNTDSPKLSIPILFQTQ